MNKLLTVTLQLNNKMENQLECIICYDEPYDINSYGYPCLCTHPICNDCLLAYAGPSNALHNICPTCRGEYSYSIEGTLYARILHSKFVRLPTILIKPIVQVCKGYIHSIFNPQLENVADNLLESSIILSTLYFSIYHYDRFGPIVCGPLFYKFLKDLSTKDEQVRDELRNL